MDDSNNFRNFEQLLKKNNAKRPLSLYNTTNNKHNPTIKPQDVLDSVYSQIKTIQLADQRSPRIASKDLGRVKSSFLTVNKLPMYNEVSKQINTFETQCVSDTQLINITVDVEALIDTHKGMTQEFDTAFTHTNINVDHKNSAVPFTHNKTDRENNKLLETQEFDTTFTQTNVDATVTFLHDKIERDAEDRSLCNETDQIQIDTELDENIYKLNNVITLREICGKVLLENKSSLTIESHSKVSSRLNMHNNHSKSSDIEEDKNNDNSIEVTNHTILNDAIKIVNVEEIRSPSPVLKLNIKNKTLTLPPPLVVSLECFERFERIALPLIDSNDDFDTCKHLVNSQILGGELCLNTNEDVIFNRCGQLSSVIEKSCEIFQNNAEESKTNKVINLNSNKESKEKRSDSLKDEILFSSDEENDFIYREFQDMPLTAALETSLYDHSDVLEKTMYVGFQTASNKSIQIFSDSFQKAQFILDEEENINGKNFSLTELVDICDKKNVSNNSGVQEKLNSTLKALEAKPIVNKDSDMTQIQINERCSVKVEKVIEDPKTKVPMVKNYDDTIKKPPEKQNFVGFKTASSKKIDLSAKALECVKKVFTDIVFDEKLNLVEQSNIETHCEKTKVNIVNNMDEDYPETDFDGKINDDLIIREFENIEMSLEEKEASCDESHKTMGFKTASNKNIDISDAAKSKIKDVFKDIGEINVKSEKFGTVNNNAEKLPQPLSSERTDNKLSSEATVFIGFKTANNKKINISAQALAKTKDMFQDIDTKLNKSVDNSKLKNNQIQAVDYSNQPSTSKAAFLGFNDTEDIKVPEVTLSKSCSLFKEIDQDNSKDLKNVAETSKHFFEGFKTASKKRVSISEQALFQSRKIFQDIEEISAKTIEENTINRKDNVSFSAFKTTKNKTLTVSEKSIARSKKLFENTETTEELNAYSFKGFQTASKRPVNVSAHALELTKKIFQDIDDVELIKIISASDSKFKDFKTGSNKDLLVEAFDASNQLLDDKATCTFVGFKTASNKNVNVSEEALAKCKKVFDNLNDLPEKTKEITQKPLGFQTADKHVDVSKEALEETEKLINDTKVPETIEKSFKGFQTASKKKVEVSKEALKKTKALFDDINISQITEQGTFKGFQTASKKKVEVSKEAIERTKAIFNDLDELKLKESASFKGFQTVSKKKVEVSEQAIGQSKQMFQDIDANANKIVNERIKLDKHAVKLPKKSIFSLQTVNNQNIDIPENVLEESKKLLEDLKDNKSPTDFNYNTNTSKQEFRKVDTTVNLDNIIDTQVVINFEDNLCTEDFKETPRKRKRSVSPILSCPRAKKKKKFETPYRDKPLKTAVDDKIIDEKPTENATEVKFSVNYKKNKIYTLKNITNFCNDSKKDVDPYITNFNLDNILNFEFESQRNELTDTKITIDQLKTIFLSAVNRNLVPQGWLDNHLKLILWKLLSYESRFSSFLCTVQNVIDQLKYRYDRELYNAERPALRKIFERDDVSTKTIVLCIAGIYVDGVNVSSVTNSKNIELLLTDGWYFIKASIDRMLTELVCKGRIPVGCKIVTNGAELMNCGQGMAPWEDTSAVRLKIFGNSTRPAPWDAKLGFARAAILTHLSSLRVDGGKISRLRAFVTRVYPLLYVEKFEDGSTVTRSERLEHLHQIKYEAERELMMERIYEEVQKEFSDQESQDSELLDSGKRKYLDSGSQIAKMMKHSKDPMEFRAHLTSSQIHLLQEHTSRYRDKMLQAIQSRVHDKLSARNVVTLARGRIAALNNKNELTKGMLSVWKPNDAILEMFTEGSWIEIMNIAPTAIRYSEIQITAGRQSMFRPAKCKNEVSLHLLSLKRTSYKISDVTQNPTMTTAYNEIDTVGIVFLIDPTNKDFESNKNFQNVYLADADKNIISVNFWGGVKKFGFENILDTGQVVACVNLQKRAGNTRKNIPQFRVTEFSHFTKTPKNLQAREMVDDINKKLFGLDRRKFCDDCVEIRNNYAAIRCLNNSENESPYRYPKSDYSLARNKMFIDTPTGVKSNKIEDINFNLTGLDFESSFKQDLQELSPKTMLRKKKVNEKIAKLKMYGEPPPLSPINIINKSVNAKNSYKSPLVSANSSITTPNNVQKNGASTSNKLADESSRTTSRDERERSPVISITRVYNKSVPVKLNFANDLVDQFAEEFDGSPPLSLD